jgi:triosephosphate isomerase
VDAGYWQEVIYHLGGTPHVREFADRFENQDELGDLSMLRQRLIVGNWKMFTTAATARRLAAEVVEGLGAGTRVRVVLCPPAPYLDVVGEVVNGTAVALGAQNFYPEKEGSFTGETGINMLLDLGCRFVIVGHSERRHKLGEDDSFINRKVHAALVAGLGVIVCVGESLEHRRGGETRACLENQLTGALAGLTGEQVGGVVVAYEPVWAIGTGVNATPEQAQEGAAQIREQVKELFGEEAARALPILDGGSIDAANAATLMHLPDIDGGLIGHASLEADGILSIIRSAD